MKAAQSWGFKGIKIPLCAALLFIAMSAHSENVSMELQDLGRGMYRLEGHLIVPADLQTAWSVLSDYRHIHEFVSSMRRSEIKEFSSERIVLEQEALGKVFLFSKRIHVVLDVREEPRSRIRFEDLAKRDFTYYAGSWQLTEVPQGVELIYRLDCQRRFSAPNFVAKDAMRKAAEQLLAEVGREMVRRKQSAISQKGILYERS
jgi:hypothetical protein